MAAADYTVPVRDYRRIREGLIEHVRRHKRRPRRWWKRPKA